MLSNIQDSKKYESLVFDRDIYKDKLLTALNIVKKFIIDEKLILTGGMAIDFALREKGSQLYPDDSLPDYDFYSSDFSNCAYKLGKILCDAGLPNISVISAFHPTTMRVRVEFIAVADITYIPKKVLKIIPTMKTHEGIIYEHPFFKYMNIHRALSYPYENPPMEVILHRWKKDICRFDILYKFYPITPKKIKDPKFVKMSKYKLDKPYCIGGFTALAYWMGNKGLYTLESKKYGVPICTFISDYPNSFIFGKCKEKFSEILDNTPGRVVFTTSSGDKMEVLDNRGKMLSAYYDKKNKFHVANLQFLMCYFLSMFYFYDIKKDDKKICLWAYKKCEELIANADPAKQPELFPSAQVFGKDNLSKSYIHGFRNAQESIKKIPSDLPLMKPINIYPKKESNCKIPDKISKFDISKSWIFDIDGSSRSDLIDLSKV